MNFSDEKKVPMIAAYVASFIYGIVLFFIVLVPGTYWGSELLEVANKTNSVFTYFVFVRDNADFFESASMTFLVSNILFPVLIVCYVFAWGRPSKELMNKLGSKDSGTLGAFIVFLVVLSFFLTFLLPSEPDFNGGPGGRLNALMLDSKFGLVLGLFVLRVGAAAALVCAYQYIWILVYKYRM